MIVGVWVLGNGLSKAMSEGGTTFLGGDLAVNVANVALTDAEVDGLRGLGEVSSVTELRTSARIGDARAAVELKGVDAAYPLYGMVRLQSGRSLEQALAPTDGALKAIVEPAFLTRMGAKVGDTLQLGEARFEIADVLLLEPDRLSAGRFMVGPRILIGQSDMAAAEVIQLGSLVEYRYRLRTPAGADAGAAVDAAEEMQPERGWELETPTDAGDRVRRTVQRTTTFLGMAGIVALVIGLAGTWAAAKAWIGRRARTIALYQLSGASPGIVIALHAVILAVASAIGVVIGALLAAAVVLPVTQLIAAELHLTLTASALLGPFGTAVAILVLGIVGTSVIVLSAIGSIRPGAAMRDSEVSLGGHRGQAAVGALVVLAALTAATLSLPIPEIAMASVIGLGAAAGGLAIVALALARAGASIRVRGFLSLVVQKGLGNGATVAARAVAIGIGIAGITALVSAQHSLETALRSELPDRVPDLVLIDVQPDQVERLRARVESDPGLGGLQANPFMRFTLTAVNGVPAAEALVRDDKAWVIEGDRSFSWTAEPTGAELLAGDWWPADYSGPALVSPEEDLAEAFDLKPGDTLTYSVLGRTFTSEVANIRMEYHRTFRPEFLLVGSPSPFRDAPHSWIMSLQGMDAADASTLRDGNNDGAADKLIQELGRDYPNVTAIDVRPLAAQFLGVIDGAIGASLLVALLLIVAGAMSIASVTATEVDARRRDAIVFSLVGASRREVAVVRLIEASAIGLVAAIVGGLAGLLGGYFAATDALRIDWVPGAMAVVLPIVLGVLAALPAALVGGLFALPRGRGQMLRHLSG